MVVGLAAFYGEMLEAHNKKFPFAIAASGVCVKHDEELTVMGMQRYSRNCGAH